MRQPRKDSSDDGTPSAKSLEELLKLLQKLNAKLQGKIFPPLRKKEKGTDSKAMVVIILTQAEEKSRPPKTISRPEKPKPLKDDWIQGFCDEIERKA